MGNRSFFLLLVLALVSLSGCQENIIAYAVKQGMKQGSLVLKAEPVDELLKKPQLDERTRTYLELSKEVLSFAENELEMNVGRSYRTYFDVQRSWITKIVVAAHRDKLEPHLFTYPIVGELPYKGFFDEEEALAFQEKLNSQNLDTYVREVPAFSSLGWWPDPIFSTMFEEEVFFAELMLHELVHLNFYFDSEADFNEAFASWFAHQATLEFIQKKVTAAKQQSYLDLLEKDLKFQLKFISFMKEITAEGNKVYADQSLDLLAKRKMYFNWIEKELARHPELEKLKEIKWNNAYIVSVNTYYDLYDDIESYAKKNNLNPKSFLKNVVREGADIVKDIVPVQGP